MKNQAFNPYLPGYEYIPDGEPHVFDGRVYIYGSHDRFDGTAFCMNDYVTWSAPVDDLSDWRYEGVIYRKDQDPTYKKGKYMYAPDVCQGPDGRYYLYYGMSTGLTRKTWVISCAVSDSPAGPFEYYGDVDLYKWSKDYLPFDPAVYVEDGRVWLYYGSAMFYPMLDASRRKIRGGAVVELEPDMLTVKGEPKLTVPMEKKDNGLGKHAFFEASSLRKIGDRYYFIYSSQNGHELCYATSDRPDGEFTYGGTLVSIGNIGLGTHKDVKSASNYTGNTHGSILEANGKYYVFYHRQTNRHCYSRQDCAEEIHIEEDGSIKQVETTSCGLNGGPLRGTGTYEARIACDLVSSKGCRFQGSIFKASKGVYPYFTQSGEDREENSDQYIANMHKGSYAGFRYFDIENLSKISVEVRSKGEGMILVGTSPKSSDVCTINISKSDSWKSFEGKAEIGNGVHALYFTWTGKKALDFNTFTLG